ncbi:MAG: hypothetical protein GC180_05185 [Bacteroidetes bacterium]|nr:hypothetical protein [Bacteroidota bacterium]
MKTLILALILIPSLLSAQKYKAHYINYAANLSATYHWNQYRWGVSFNSNFNISKSAKFPLFIGFNVGMSAVNYHGQLSQSKVNSYAIENMKGTQLVSAKVDAGSNSGISGGVNIAQFFFTNHRAIPSVGIGVRATRFPKDEASITYVSHDSKYTYHDGGYMTISPAFWTWGVHGYMAFGDSPLALQVGYYPNKGNGIKYAGIVWLICDGYNHIHKR